MTLEAQRPPDLAAPDWQRNVRLLAGVHLLSGAAVSIVMPFLPLYLAEIEPMEPDALALWSGLAYSLPALGMMLASPVWGALGDRRGRKPMLARSTAGGALALVLMSMCTSVVQFALLRLLQGLLMGTLAASNALLASTVPAERQGRALGLLRTMHWLGLGAGPLLGGVMADSVGHRGALLVGSLLLAATTVAILAGVRDEHRPPTAAAPVHRSPLREQLRPLLQPALLRLYFIDLLSEMARFMVIPVIPLLLIELSGGAGGVATLGGMVLGLRALSGALGAYIGGGIGDQFGHRATILAAAAASALLFVPQAFLGAPWQLVTLQALAGVFAAMVVPTVAVLLARQAPLGTTGVTYGIGSSFQSAGRFLGPLLGAAVASWLGVGSALLLVAAIFVLIGVVAASSPRAAR